MSFSIKYDGDGKVIGSDYKEVIEEEVEIEEQAPVQVSTQESNEDDSNVVEADLPEDTQNKLPDNDGPLQRELPKVHTESNKERNLRILREANEENERELVRKQRDLDRALARAEELERRYTVKKEEPEEELPYGADEKLYKKSKEQDREIAYLKNQAMEMRIRSEFPDINKVVTPEALTILKRLKPRQAALVDNSTNLYEAAALAYEFIKDSGIYEPEDTYVEKKQAVQKNLSKPKSVVSISPQRGESPLHKANEYQGNGFPTAAEIARLRREVEEASKQY